MRKEYWFVLISAILSGGITFGGQIFSDYGFSIVELSILPFIFTTIILLPFVIFNKKYKINFKQWRLWLFYGFVSILIGAGQFAAIKFGLSVATTVLLISTQPLWTIIFSKLFLKEDITKSKIIACLLVIIGAAVLIKPDIDGNWNWAGIIAGLIAGLGLALWNITGNYASKTNNHPVSIKFMETTSMLLISALVYPIILFFFPNPEISRFTLSWPITIWIILLVFNLLTQIFSHILIFQGFKKISASTAGIILLLEPVSAALLAAIFLGQSITTNIIIGGSIIIIANYIVAKEN